MTRMLTSMRPERQAQSAGPNFYLWICILEAEHRTTELTFKPAILPEFHQTGQFA